MGEAYKRGIEYAIKQWNPELIIEMDADLQHSPTMLPVFIFLSQFGFSFIIGSRFAPGGTTPNFSLRRKTISLIGNWMVRVFGGVHRIRDCTSGYRCIKTEMIKKCDFSLLSTKGYAFQASFLCELLTHGAKVIEVPIEFPDRMHGKSKLSFQDKLEFLVNIFKISFRKSQKHS